MIEFGHSEKVCREMDKLANEDHTQQVYSFGSSHEDSDSNSNSGQGMGKIGENFGVELDKSQK